MLIKIPDGGNGFNYKCQIGMGNDGLILFWNILEQESLFVFQYLVGENLYPF